MAIAVNSSFSLYDMIAMIVPGSAIELAFIRLGNECNGYTSETDETAFWVAFLVMAYLIGIVDELISNFLTYPIRNNQYLLEDMINGKWSKRSALSKIWYFGKFGVNQWRDCTKKFFKSSLQNSDYTVSVDRYYQAYYYAQSHRIGNHINIMEAQLAFMRNMIIPLIIWRRILPWSCYWIILILLIILLIFAIPMRIVKIHRCIFEDYKYLYGMNGKNSDTK